MFQPLDIGTGTLTLAATSGGSKIRLWSDAGKSNGPISLPKQWNLAGIASNPIPSALYVEGFNVSDAVRDVGLRLVYEAGGFSVEDKVKLTVFKLDLDADINMDGAINDSDDPDEDTPGKPGLLVGVNNNTHLTDEGLTEVDYADKIINGPDDRAYDLKGGQGVSPYNRE